MKNLTDYWFTLFGFPPGIDHNGLKLPSFQIFWDNSFINKIAYEGKIIEVHESISYHPKNNHSQTLR